MDFSGHYISWAGYKIYLRKESEQLEKTIQLLMG